MTKDINTIKNYSKKGLFDSDEISHSMDEDMNDRIEINEETNQKRIDESVYDSDEINHDDEEV